MGFIKLISKQISLVAIYCNDKIIIIIIIIIMSTGCDYIGNIQKLITLCWADDYGFILISTLKIYLRRLNMRSTHKKVIINL